MKLNSLASAVSISLAALALTACGGNDSNTTASVAPAPAPKPIETPKPADPAPVVPPTKTSDLPNNTNSDITKVNSLIADFDAAKTLTVAATEYVRKVDSNYERASNPTPENTSRSVLAVTGNLNEQNPYLSNYLVGAEIKDGKVMGHDYLGQYAGKQLNSRAGEKQHTQGNVEVTAFATTNNNGEAVTRANIDGVSKKQPSATGYTPLLQYSLDQTKKDAGQEQYSIQDVNIHHVAVSDVLTANGKTFTNNQVTLLKGNTAQDGYGVTGLVGYSASVSGTGSRTGYSLNYGLPENDPTATFKDYAALVAEDYKALSDAQKAKTAADAKVAAAQAAIAANTGTPGGTPTEQQALADAQKEQTAADAKLKIEQAAKAYDAERGLISPSMHLNNQNVVMEKNKLVYNTKPTRVFGKNYRDYSSNAGKLNKLTNEIEGQDANPYVNSYRAYEVKNADGDLVYSTGNAFTLKDVQYGRLTANIDALNADLDEKVEELYYRSFVNAGTPGSTDIYFARGTNSTTLEQMKAVKEAAKGGKLEYRGHALTYGVSPDKSITKKSGYENSFGNGKNIQTLGNFVHAVYDTSANKLNGNIYNFINADVNDANSQYLRNDLVSFGGDVVGNTIVNGTSSYNQETGSFVGSFYGNQAQELGGQVSSVAEGFAKAKWGAVFGAQKVGSGITNQEQNQTNNRP